MRAIVQALKESSPKRVVVIGDVMLDEYVMGDVERISPEAPIPVVKEKSTDFRLGGAANVALNCKSIGCTVDMVGFVGVDIVGERLKAMLAEYKIASSGIVQTTSRVTTLKKRIVSQQQQLLRIDREDTVSQSEEERHALICHIHTLIQPGSIVVISDYAKGVISKPIVAEIIARAKICNVLVLVDPKGPDFTMYKGVSYLKPNMKEFNQMISFFGLNRSDSLEDNGRKICEQLNLDGLIITMGEKGLCFISRTDYKIYPAHKRDVFDVSGAGDTVLAFMAIGLVQGLSLDESLTLANHAASIAVSHYKNHVVTIDELLGEKLTCDEKWYRDWKSLKIELALLKQDHGKKIVFTNGCFDLLHAGHIFVLQEAKKRGDILVVALNTDDSVKRYKGPSRPVNTLLDRIKVIAAIGVVDYVVVFDEDTPEKLIKFLKPDVLVKGGDYKVEDLAGYDEIISYGGTVEVVSYQQGLSTTNLIKKLQN